MRKTDIHFLFFAGLILIMGIMLCSCQAANETNSPNLINESIIEINTEEIITQENTQPPINGPTHTTSPESSATFTRTPTETPSYDFEWGTYIKFSETDLEAFFIKRERSENEYYLENSNGLSIKISILENTEKFTRFSIERSEKKCEFITTQGSLIFFSNYLKANSNIATPLLYAPGINQFLSFSTKYVAEIGGSVPDIPPVAFAIDLLPNDIQFASENFYNIELLLPQHRDITMLEFYETRDLSYVLPDGSGYRWDTTIPYIQMDCSGNTLDATTFLQFGNVLETELSSDETVYALPKLDNPNIAGIEYFNRDFENEYLQETNDLTYETEIGWEFHDLRGNYYLISNSKNDDQGTHFSITFIPAGKNQLIIHKITIPQYLVVDFILRSDDEDWGASITPFEYCPTMNMFLSAGILSNFAYEIKITLNGEIEIYPKRMERNGGCDLKMLHDYYPSDAYKLPDGNAYYLDKCEWPITIETTGK